MLAVAVKQSDGLEIETVFQSLCPSFDVPVQTSPSGWKCGKQAVARVILDYLFISFILICQTEHTKAQF